jgi:regulator of CtrA degradation
MSISTLVTPQGGWDLCLMSDDQAVLGRPDSGSVTFMRLLAGSDSFKVMFREGMALVEQTASYLDGDGRRESGGLSRAGSLAYATESMRLTTRLMQLASWLLLQRAVNDGEMTSERAGREREKVKLGGLSTATEGQTWEELPERLRELITRSLRLQERIRRLDAASCQSPHAGNRDNPVARELSRIAAAFSPRHG